MHVTCHMCDTHVTYMHGCDTCACVHADASCGSSIRDVQVNGRRKSHSFEVHGAVGVFKVTSLGLLDNELLRSPAPPPASSTPSTSPRPPSLPAAPHEDALPLATLSFTLSGACANLAAFSGNAEGEVVYPGV